MHSRIAAFVALCLVASPAIAETYTVTTYVTKVQEERESTRWTLTEWLRIKERMRMMDLWLALFSDPKKDHFSPELNLTYLTTRGAGTLTDGAGAATTSSLSGTQARAELWLTNIVSSTVGIRTLNIDLGAEGYQRVAQGFAPELVAAVDASADSGAATSAATARALKHSYYTGNLRLFGKSIQDSSLVLKYGEYVSDNSIPSDEGQSERYKGKVAGAGLQVYVLKWLGAEGNYLAYGDALKPVGSKAQSGTYYDYAGFVEVSLLRLMVGRYQEDWSFENLPNGGKTSESGITVGAKLMF